MSWIFTTNELCRLCFGVEKMECCGDRLGDLVEQTIGKENWRRYGIAQDPIPGGQPGTGKIVIYVGEPGDHRNDDNYVVIGKVERLP